MSDREDWLEGLAVLERIERSLRKNIWVLQEFGGSASKLHTLFLEDADALRAYIQEEKMP